MVTILVLTFLILVCGFIAYAGDLIGRRLGKRRLSAFGLRPRYTAILCTVITGIVIAVITLGVLMGLSAGVRMAVTQGEALVVQNREYRREAAQLRGESAVLSQEIVPLRSQNEELAGRNSDLAEANGRLANSNKRLTASVNDLAGARKDLQRVNHGLATENQSARGRLERTLAELKQAQSDLAQARKSLLVSSRALSRSRTDLAANRQLLRDNEHEYLTLKKRVQTLRSMADQLALSKVIVRQGDVLGRVTVTANTTATDAHQQVRSLIDRVRSSARERGARRKGPYLEAYLLNSRLAALLGRTLDWPAMLERDMVQALATLVAQSGEDVLLQAVAVQNTVQDEPVPFDIVPFWNSRAFMKGEEVASTVIDPSQTRGEILEDLATWLRTGVRQAAAERRVIPGRGNELGEVRYDPLLEVIDKVKSLGVPAKVGAVAARDLRSADSLALDFYVVPADTPVASRATPVADAER